MQPQKHLLATCSVLLIAALLAACAAPAAAPTAIPAPPTDTPMPPAAESDPVAVVHAWADAMYRGDVDAALDLFTDDGSYMIGGTASRPQEMRWLFDWYASLETKWEILDCQPKDASIACDLAVLDGCIAASGSKGLPVKATFTLQDGKIKEAVGSGTGPEWNAYWDFTSTSGSWMHVFRPEEYARFQEGTVEGGKLIVKLCREYENAVKIQEPATAAAAQALVDALNSGDADAAMALLTDDARFRLLNEEAAGTDQLRALFDRLAGEITQYQITDCEWRGISTLCAMTVVDGCIAAFGASDGLPGKMTFRSLEDGTLQSVSGLLAGAEPKSYEEWVEAERAWASANRADELAQAEGYSQAAGAMAVKLCQEYAAAQAPVQEPVSVVRAWLDAINDGDLDAAMALMTPDAQIPNWGPTRNVLDWWINIDSQNGAPECQAKGNRLACTFTHDDGCIAAFGATGGLPVRFTFTLQDGKIQRVDVEEMGDGWANYGKWSGEELTWAQANRPDELAKIDFETLSEGGGIAIKLCREYAETLK